MEHDLAGVLVGLLFFALCRPDLVAFWECEFAFVAMSYDSLRLEHDSARPAAAAIPVAVCVLWCHSRFLLLFRVQCVLFLTGLDGRLVVWEIPTLDIDMNALGL